eukprot:3845415-Rhodomonas_salina.1
MWDCRTKRRVTSKQVRTSFVRWLLGWVGEGMGDLRVAPCRGHGVNDVGLAERRCCSTRG